MSAKEGHSTGIFNSLVFHTNSIVDFDCVVISDTVSDVFVAMSVTFCVEGCKFLPLYTPFSSCLTKAKPTASADLRPHEVGVCKEI